METFPHQYEENFPIHFQNSLVSSGMDVLYLYHNFTRLKKMFCNVGL